MGQAGDVTVNTEALHKAIGSAGGHRTQLRRGMEPRSVIVPADGICHKLKEELENDGAMLFGSLFLT